MNNTDRRTFLKLIGSSSLAAAMPADLDRALAIPAHNRHGSIRDVEHIVILMQENRSFDHYFGMMRGVRGFSDPRAVKLASGKPVWHQPDGSGTLLPFRPDVEDLGQTFLPDPPHGWNDSHAAWNNGKYDQWVPQKGVTTMTYHTRKDLPYQYALADAFTICDNYYCSLLGPTDPNRYHMWTGWVGNDGAAGGPVITNAELGYDWSTYPERLERSGISWKIYQDIGVGLDAPGFWGWTNDPFIGNYGDNSLLYFHQYQNALPGNPLADRAKVGTNIDALGRNPLRLMDKFRDGCDERKAPAGVVDRGAGGVHRTPELGAGLRRVVHVAGDQHPGVEPRGVEQDGALHHLRRRGRFLRSSGSSDSARHPGRRALDRADHERDLPWRRRPPGRAVRLRHSRPDDHRLAVEQGRVGQLGAVRSHVVDSLPRDAIRRSPLRPRSKATSRHGGARSPAI